MAEVAARKNGILNIQAVAEAASAKNAQHPPEFSTPSKNFNEELKTGYRYFLTSFGWQFTADTTRRFPSKNFNEEINSLRYLFFRINRDIFGRRWYKHSESILAAAAIEHFNTHLHSHVILVGIPAPRLYLFNCQRYQYIYNKHNNNIPKLFKFGSFISAEHWQHWQDKRFVLHQEIGCRIDKIKNISAKVNYLTKYFSPELLNKDKVFLYLYPE